MKRFRALLLPLVCFAAAWSITFHVSQRHPAPETADSAGPATRTKRIHQDSRKISIAQLDHQFRSRPMSDWADLWARFATTATAADLEEIPRRLRVPRYQSQRRDASNVLVVLAVEELAMRADQPLPIETYAYAALAESDPEAALRELERNNRIDIATATLRTLAWHDPAGALRHLQDMPLPGHMPGAYEGDAGEGGMGTHSPTPAIHAAWARRDPAAAAAAVMELPLSERTAAATEVAMSWVHRDGPAAVRFITPFVKAAGGTEISRFRHILRASFASHPEETAKLMEDPVLRNAMASSKWYREHVLKPWYDADPDGVVDWLMESRDDDRVATLFERVGHGSEGTAELIARLSAAGYASIDERLKTLHYHDADLALDLADELGITLAEDLPRRIEVIEDDPEAACDLWLEALRRHGDPDAALAELGWTRAMATHLATRASRIFPQKAAALAERVPSSALDGSHLGPVGNNEINRFWPELGQVTPANATYPVSFSFPTARFSRDPAAAAEEFPLQALSEWNVRTAVEDWAPYDFAAAREWLSRVPEGESRQAGELALLKIQAPRDPLAVLAYLQNHPVPTHGAREVWQRSLHRLVQTGGDWRDWLARPPAGLDQPYFHFGGSGSLEESLAAEARLLELLRDPSSAGDFGQ